MKKVKDLRAKTKSELEELFQANSKKIAESRFYHAQARSKNVKEVRELRRESARILTILAQMQEK